MNYHFFQKSRPKELPLPKASPPLTAGPTGLPAPQTATQLDHSRPQEKMEHEPWDTAQESALSRGGQA